MGLKKKLEILRSLRTHDITFTKNNKKKETSNSQKYHGKSSEIGPLNLVNDSSSSNVDLEENRLFKSTTISDLRPMPYQHKERKKIYYINPNDPKCIPSEFSNALDTSISNPDIYGSNHIHYIQARFNKFNFEDAQKGSRGSRSNLDHDYSPNLPNSDINRDSDIYDNEFEGIDSVSDSDSDSRDDNYILQSTKITQDLEERKKLSTINSKGLHTPRSSIASSYSYGSMSTIGQGFELCRVDAHIQYATSSISSEIPVLMNWNNGSESSISNLNLFQRARARGSLNDLEYLPSISRRSCISINNSIRFRPSRACFEIGDNVQRHRSSIMSDYNHDYSMVQISTREVQSQSISTTNSDTDCIRQQPRTSYVSNISNNYLNDLRRQSLHNDLPIPDLNKDSHRDSTNLIGSDIFVLESEGEVSDSEERNVVMRFEDNPHHKGSNGNYNNIGGTRGYIYDALRRLQQKEEQLIQNNYSNGRRNTPIITLNESERNVLESQSSWH